jgi:prevent-host-death family protein
MLSLPIADAKARFSQVMREAQQGRDVIVTRGPGKEPVAAVIPIERYRRQNGITLGLGQGLGEFTTTADWAVTDQDLLES